MNNVRRVSMWLKVSLFVCLMLALLAVISVSGGVVQADGPATPTATPLAHGTAYYNLAYANLSPAEKLDLFVPDSTARKGGVSPVIVWVHGGGWEAGTKADPPGLGLVDLGYAVASVEYRLSQEAVFPAQIYDVKAAVRWLRAHADQYKLDPDRVLAFGGSAGGHLVALLGTSANNPAVEDLSMGNATYSSRVQAVIDWFGPTDFTHIPADKSILSSAGYLSLIHFLGCDPVVCTATAKAASPMTYVSAAAPPFLIQHGSQDPIVPVRQSQIFYNALKAVGIPVELDILDGAGHGGPAFAEKDNLLKVLAFINGTIGTTMTGTPIWTPPAATAVATVTP